ncbi:MAG: hypothetical protein IJ489_05165 [Clostridia bacterium]|nr:hypothetical protein [Clostridia bacterium]
MKTNEKTLIPTDTIGHEVFRVIYADENYFYFLANEWFLIGKNGNHDLYNQSSGKIYRINRDGTNCICIFEDQNIDFQKSPIAIYEDTVLVYAREIGMINGIAQTWNTGIYIGTINEDGTIDSLEWVEVIA